MTSITLRPMLAALLMAGAAFSAWNGAAAAEGRQPRLEVVNRGSAIMDVLNVSAATNPNWGEDLLGRLQLPPGGRIIVNFPQNSDCSQDVRVVYHDQTAEERRQVNACGGEPLAFDGSHAAPVQRANTR